MANEVTCSRCGADWPGRWSEAMSLTRRAVTVQLCGRCIRELEVNDIAALTALRYLALSAAQQQQQP